MSRQAIGIGAAANDGTGDPLRTAFTKANDNFSEIYSLLGGDTLTVGGARTALGIGTADSPTFAGVTLGALSSIHFTGLTANALLYSDGTNLTQDGTNLTYTTASGPRLQVGTTGTSSGWVLGYGGASGYALIANSNLTTNFANSALFQTSAGATHLGAADGQTIQLNVANNASYGRFQLAGVAGAGPTILAGTATTDVNALSVTQTWNASGVAFTGIKYTITDTASAAGSLAMQILGGASGTTELLSLTKLGSLTIGTHIEAVGNLYTRDGGSFGSNSRGYFSFPSDGVLTVNNNAATSFGRLQFGGTTSSFPALKRSGAKIQARLADDSAAGTFEGKYNSSDSSAGVNYGPAAVTSITVKDGIITAIS